MTYPVPLPAPALSPAAMKIVNWLGELGPRWGLPGNACRVHALLYLVARPMPAAGISEALTMASDDVDAALGWLSGDRLVGETTQGWTTGTDPWELMLQALDARRTREIDPARQILRAWRNAHPGEDPVVARQAARLHDLVEDLAAIDARARALSPRTVRRLVGFGGQAARLVDRAFGKRGQG